MRWRAWAGLMILVGLLGGCGSRQPARPELAMLESRQLADRIAALPGPEAGGEVVEAFWDGLKGKFPIIEPVPGADHDCLVSFVYRGNRGTERVMIAGCPTEPDLEPMTRFEATDLWYRSIRVPSTARFFYFFQTNGPTTLPEDSAELAILERDHPHQLDPLAAVDQTGSCSLVAGPAAPPEPWLDPRPGVERGSVRPSAIYSRRLGAVREVALYAPPGWSGPGSRESMAAPVVVVLDGEMYGRDDRSPVSVPTILDNLIADRKIPPTVAVLVSAADSATRVRDMYGSDDFAAFLATELIPWVESETRVRAESRRTVILGSSAGGAGAAYAALKYPDVFGAVVALSGALQYGPGQVYTPAATPDGDNWLARQYAAAQAFPARFVLAVGQFEQRTKATDYLRAARQLHAILQEHKVGVTYREVPGGHDLAWWRDAIPAALIDLLGPDATNPAR